MLHAASAESKTADIRRSSRPSGAPDRTRLAPIAAPGNQAMLRLQRKCDCGGKPDCDCDTTAEKKEKGGLHRSASSWDAPQEAPPIVDEVLRSPGQMLDAETRTFFEARFQRDFSGVRIHADTRAAESAHAVNAHAYTVGRDIAFAPGRFAPRTNEGRSLLAHELTHVVQQHENRATGPSRISTPSDPSEVEAASVERSIHAEGAAPPVAAAAASMQRQDAGGGSGAGAAAPAAAKPGGGAALCAEHSDEAYYAKNPSYCRDTAATGSMHTGHTCYREIPSGSGCPSGKHVCFTEGKCDEKESHIDSTVPSIKRGGGGFCDLSWFGGCSLLHTVLDVIPGLLAEGLEAQGKCLESCQKLPWYGQGLCMQGCGGPTAF